MVAADPIHHPAIALLKLYLPAVTCPPATTSTGLESSRTARWESRISLEQLFIVLLGLGYLVAGFGLFYSLAVDSTDLFLVALVGNLALFIISLGVIVRREGVITAENKLIGTFVLVAMGLLIGLRTLTDLPFEVVIAVVITVGVVAPGLPRRPTAGGTE